MWGKVPPEPVLCSGLSIPEIHPVVGAESTVLFQACDDEDFPVAHSLPSAVDSRLFAALQGDSTRPITYQGEGVYEVNVRVDLHGTYVMQITLDGAKASSPLNFVATCPSTGRTDELSTGSGVAVHPFMFVIFMSV